MSDAAGDAMYPPEAERQLARVLLERARPLLLGFDRDWHLLRVHGDPARFGFDADDPALGVRQLQDLFIGLPRDEAIDLAFVEMPGGRSAHVHMMASADGYDVVLLDAQEEHDRQRAQQQLGNEAVLVGHQKTRAIEKLRQIRSELEQQRDRLEEANALKNALIATLGHDFRTPLTSIFGYLHLLEHDAQAGDSRTWLRAVQRNATWLLTLAENLLEHARAESSDALLSPSGVDPAALADDLDAMFRPLATDFGLGFAIDLDIASEERPIFDEMRVRQVLINLLSNAVRYTVQGEIGVRMSWRDSVLAIEVRDTGIGIPDEFRERVFVPFNRGAQAGSRGAGLGLSIVKRLVEQMHGELSFVSRLGEGTRFLITLPALSHDGGGAVGTLPVRESGLWIRGLSALVVDDDADVAQLLDVLLGDLGFRVRTTGDAASAVEQALAEPPDLLLVDVELPGLSGNTAVFRLRSSGYRGRIITLSATPTDEARSAAIAAGADHYLVKPLNIEQFVRVVQRAVAG